MGAQVVIYIYIYIYICIYTYREREREVERERERERVQLCIMCDCMLCCIIVQYVYTCVHVGISTVTWVLFALVIALSLLMCLSL